MAADNKRSDMGGHKEVAMTASSLLSQLPGTWTGRSRLFLPPDKTFSSTTEATITAIAQDRFLHLAYSWSMEEKPQNGLLIFPSDPDTAADQSVWIDSWHMQAAIMVCKTRYKGHAIILDGSYAAPPGPDWGWRIQIAVGVTQGLRLRMFNIPPGGQEILAVDAAYGPAERPGRSV